MHLLFYIFILLSSEEDVSSNNLTTMAEVQLKHIHNHEI